MGSFNLIDEEWILVLDANGEQQKVSLETLFSNAQNYMCLAGETEFQNFAILRVLESVLLAAYSACDYRGDPYPCSPKSVPVAALASDSTKKQYKKELRQCWRDLWEHGKFSRTVLDYLQEWHDRFYLYDDKYPFFQITETDVKTYYSLKKKFPTPIRGRNLNRMISESGNKLAIFSPVSLSNRDARKGVKVPQLEEFKDICRISVVDEESGKEKQYQWIDDVSVSELDSLPSDALARWIITYQGYSGTGEKKKWPCRFPNSEHKEPCISYGSLYPLGGLYASGNNLFQTLILNLILVHPEFDADSLYKVQKPCWERDSKENIEILSHVIATGNVAAPDNLAELYTTWGRAIYIDPKIEKCDQKVVGIIKFPAVDMSNEPMTLWTYDDKKSCYVPYRPQAYQKLWQHFGLLTLRSAQDESRTHKRPALMTHIDNNLEFIQKSLPYITIHFVTVDDDHNMNSRAPRNEITDSLTLDDMLLTGDHADEWIESISDAIETSKRVAKNYWFFMLKVGEHRGKSTKKIQGKSDAEKFADANTQVFYQHLNQPFTLWLTSISPEDDQQEKVIEWYKELYYLSKRLASNVLDGATLRDYVMRELETSDSTENIASLYMEFNNRIRKYTWQSNV